MILATTLARAAPQEQSTPDALAALTTPMPLTLAVVPGALSLSSATAGATVSGAVTVKSSGGVPPYRFTWERTGRTPTTRSAMFVMPV